MTFGVKYLGPLFDSSGYAEFSRNNVAALHLYSNVTVTTENVTFENQKTHFGKAGEIAKSLLVQPTSYQLKITNLTPNFMQSVREPGVKNISYTMFETDKIPLDWVESLNKYSDACFVPCEHNKEVFE